MADHLIYVLDDDYTVVQSLVATLRSAKYKAQGCHSLDMLRVAMQACVPDLVVAELMLRGRVCSELMHLAEHHPSLPIMLLCGGLDAADRLDGIQLRRQVSIYRKPLPPTLLLKYVADLLAQTENGQNLASQHGRHFL